MKIKKYSLVLLLMGTYHLASAQVTNLPIDFNGKQIYIPVKSANGDSLRFIFDSGSTGSMIDSASAAKAGISKENRQSVNVAGSGGTQNYDMVTGQNLTLGGLQIKDLRLVVVDFSALSQDLGKRMDGIIGYDLLTKYVTQIDFDNRKLILYNHISELDTTGYIGIPFEFSKGILIPRFPVSVKLANGETFTGKVMFDTGCGFTLLVSTPFSKFHHFDEKLGKTLITGGRGMNAETRDQVAVIESMSFDGFDFGKMQIRLTVNEQAEPKEGYLGIMGIEVIKRFNVIVDYADKKIYLKPNRDYKDSFVTTLDLEGEVK